jgi:hypothetical protein
MTEATTLKPGGDPRMHPLTVQIITRDTAAGREVRHQYVVQARYPRWELLKIFVHAFVHLTFR